VLQGFEARGTYISDRIRSYDRLIADTYSSPAFLTSHVTRTINTTDYPSHARSDVDIETNENEDIDEDVDDGTTDNLNAFDLEGYFCDIPRKYVTCTSFVEQCDLYPSYFVYLLLSLLLRLHHYVA